ncbi:MAG: arginine--tRNA ligase, partial [Bacteroidia bacterium]|nr:arginine--tRNA ligase [Bacteroidia bacterium]
MYAIKERIRTAAAAAVKKLYDVVEVPPVQATSKEHAGDLTVVLFALAKHRIGALEKAGEDVGREIARSVPEIGDWRVVKGFLNLSLNDDFWQSVLDASDDDAFLHPPPRREKIVVEYCSPNTNKPIHLGHLRNMAIGESVCRILEAAGAEVVRVCLFNDRGIHICKSMTAFLDAGGDDSPEKSGLKGDHLVGRYYVEFEKKYRDEVKALVASGASEAEAENRAPSLERCRQMLRDWEAGDPQTRTLWKRLNDWVYEGFGQTFARYGVRFDHWLYESELWQRGKAAVLEALENGVFYRKEDGSVWMDLTDAGLDHKLVLRSDGTSVYITQDLGVADFKYERFGPDRSVYVIANEQDYHMKVLKLMLRRMGRTYAEGVEHLSYGMVDLPTGRMKSREGTVVDADDIMDEMFHTARAATDELGKTESLSAEELNELYETLGQGALKYFLLKPDPGKRIVFNPAESIDFK